MAQIGVVGSQFQAVSSRHIRQGTAVGREGFGTGRRVEKVGGVVKRAQVSKRFPVVRICMVLCTHLMSYLGLTTGEVVERNISWMWGEYARWDMPLERAASSEAASERARDAGGVRAVASERASERASAASEGERGCKGKGVCSAERGGHQPAS